MSSKNDLSENMEFDIVVVGAGIAGLSSALEAAETGFSVLLVEKNPYVGGRVAQLYEYFPKLCPPTCGLEINLKRLRENDKIRLLTLATITNIENNNGSFKLTVQQKPRFVNNRCTLCNECVDACPVERPNDFNFGLDKTKAIYYPYNNAYPQRYVIDPQYCQFESCKMCVEVCKYQAIDLTEKKKLIQVSAKSVILATGWDPYDASNLDYLGYGKYPNVITNMIMERLASPSGPTKGELKLPGFDEPFREVAFVQCAGSRDENHLEYCSSICCLASMKQANYIREQYPDAKIHIFYIDLRANGILEDFYNKVKNDPQIEFHRGKVARISKGNSRNSLLIEAEDTLTGKIIQKEVDLVVLATGMQPSAKTNFLPINGIIDENGFVRSNLNNGIYGCGVCVSPKDVASVVQEATGAAMKAIIKVKEVQ